MARRFHFTTAALAAAIFMVATSAASAETAPAEPAIAALDAAPASDWLSQSSIALLGRVIAASSKAALDEAATRDARAQALVGSGYLVGAHGYPQDNAEAARYLKLGARDNAIAQVNYGVMLQDGRATKDGKPDLPGAREQFALAARQGHPVASYNLAIFNRDGIAMDRNISEAIRLLKRAADTPNARQGQALYELARILETGNGVAKDDKAAEKYYEAAGNMWHADSLLRLGERDYGVADDAESYEEFEYWAASAEDMFRKAFAVYQRDADAGDAYAMRRLGDLYRGGTGTAMDLAQAFRWYKAAADRGDRPAKFSLGHMYLHGQGVAKDEAAGVAIIRDLADAGDAASQNALATLYANGTGVKKDDGEAIRYFMLAAKQGDEVAQHELKKRGVSKW